DAWADPLTVGIHEIDGHDLVLDQIIVEPNFLVFVSAQDDVGEIALSDYFARGHRGVAPPPRQKGARHRSHPVGGQEGSSTYAGHSFIPFSTSRSAGNPPLWPGRRSRPITALDLCLPPARCQTATSWRGPHEIGRASCRERGWMWADRVEVTCR